MRSGKLLIGLGAVSILAASTGITLAQDLGVPKDWAYGYQEPVTEVARQAQSQSFNLHVVATVITIFVTILLAYTCWRFSEKRNPVSRRFSHNTAIEVAWTLIPVLILVGLAVPSIRYLYFQETVPPSEVTVKAIGASGWYWTYEYEVDGEIVAYDSTMLGNGYATYDGMKAALEAEGAGAAEIPSPELWKLKSSAPMVVPVNTNVTVNVTSEPGGILHAFAVPAFAVKVDAVPGQLNATWFNSDKVGTFYGQCSELCGQGHSYMPIEVEVVSKEDFEARLKEVIELANGPSAKPDVKLAETKLAD